MYKKIKYIVVFILIFSSSLIANKLIDIDKTTANIISSSYIYVDKKNLETIDSIKNKEFKEINGSKPLSFGYSPDFTIWIKFTLINNTNEVQKRILQYGSPLATHINLYYDNKVIHEGLFQITPNRKMLKPYFELSLKEKENKTYYLQLSSKITTLIVNYKLYEVKNFYEEELSRQNILIFFFTAMFILAIYETVQSFVSMTDS